MRRAVLGAVSPVALAKEIERFINEGRRSAMAAGFELVELGSCLKDARALSAAKPEWATVINEGIDNIGSILDRIADRHPELAASGKPFHRYARAVAAWRAGDRNS